MWKGRRGSSVPYLGVDCGADGVYVVAERAGTVLAHARFQGLDDVAWATWCQQYGLQGAKVWLGLPSAQVRWQSVVLPEGLREQEQVWMVTAEVGQRWGWNSAHDAIDFLPQAQGPTEVAALELARLAEVQLWAQRLGLQLQHVGVSVQALLWTAQRATTAAVLVLEGEQLWLCAHQQVQRLSAWPRGDWFAQAAAILAQGPAVQRVEVVALQALEPEVLAQWQLRLACEVVPLALPLEGDTMAWWGAWAWLRWGVEHAAV